MRKSFAVMSVMILVGALSIAFAAAPESAKSSSAIVGQPAPAFSLQDQNGKTVSLSELSGKTVVLEWFNDECPIDRRCYEDGMNDTANKAIAEGVVWLAVDSTGGHDMAHQKAAAEKMGLNRPVLNDESGAVGHAYAATNTPHMYIIDGKGTLVYKGAIDSNERGNKAKSDVTNYVSQALTELMAGKPVSMAETRAYGCNVHYKE